LSKVIISKTCETELPETSTRRGKKKKIWTPLLRGKIGGAIGHPSGVGKKAKTNKESYAVRGDGFHGEKGEDGKVFCMGTRRGKSGVVPVSKGG